LITFRYVQLGIVRCRIGFAVGVASSACTSHRTERKRCGALSPSGLSTFMSKIEYDPNDDDDDAVAQRKYPDE
jgi:hypothetical protein